MNFFAAQDQARRRTGRLVLLFGLAVAALVLATNLFMALFFGYFSRDGGIYPAGPAGLDITRLPWTDYAWITAGVLLVIACGTGLRWLQLRQGGRAVAEAMGGLLVPQDEARPDQRRALNVVAEMAIASGLPVPPLYIIDSPGINAFAAGHNADDLVVALTRGALEHLDRDELQAVIGHEFSHLLHGDCRLNMQLMAVLYGILCIGLLGETLIRGGVGISRRRRDSGLALVGLGLLVLGSAGTFFGRLIKAAVSRQREFLADASAVQYTRNPDGMAAALKKIGGWPLGSDVSGAAAEEVSHMWFGASSRRFFSQWFATHPPLAERIRAIEPRWNGQFPQVSAAPVVAHQSSRSLPAAALGAASSGAPQSAPAAEPLLIADQEPSAASSANLTSMLDQGDTEPEPEDVRTVQADLHQLPTALQQAAAHPDSARMVVVSLMLATADNDRSRELQLAALTSSSNPVLPRALATLHSIATSTRVLSGQQRRHLLALAMPSLKQQSGNQYQQFLASLKAMVQADQQISLAEWCLYTQVQQGMAGHFRGSTARHHRLRRPRDAAAACAEVLAALAWAGQDDAGSARLAWRTGMTQLQLAPEVMPDRSDPNCRRLAAAVTQLRTLYPLARPALLKACVAAIEEDGMVFDPQLDLLAALAALLDCPLPPHSLHG